VITAIDTNILIDLLAGTHEEVDRAESAIRTAHAQGALLLPIVCYSELAFRFEQRKDLDDLLGSISITLLPLDREAAFLAGSFFREYLKRGGVRTRILADFIVAAQAQLSADRLLTGDKRFFGTSFPNLKAVGPEDFEG
jgi:predicted nucleic acid-binding protein